MRKFTTIFGCLLMMFMLGCSNSEKGKKESEEQTSEGTAPADVAEEAPSVFFKYPEDGATVPSPVFIEMGVKGMQVEPAGEVKEGFGHHHVLINMKSWPKGEVIPASDSTIHFGKGQTDASIELEAGEYTIALQFADGVHASYGEEMAASITIKVE